MSLRRWLRPLLLGAVLFAVPVVAALDYHLKPRKIAENTYVFVGKTEDFTRANGGNIVNTGFIVTTEGVVVIDSGPSKLYGEQMRKAIRAVTPQRINRVLITHHHPDHYFGNQAYGDVPIYALSGTIAGMKEEGGPFADNLYRMSGDWMKDTESLPAKEVANPGALKIGGHELELIALQGHTQGDLAVLDRTTGVLFAGDLVFHQRAATTPHADIQEWLRSLAVLQKVQFKIMVPGHGDPVTDARGIEQTRRYLTWLESALTKAAADGMDMPELLAAPIPAEFAGIPLVQSEYERSIAHLFRGFEARVLGRAE
jgi:uncharacterized sulfatase